MKLKTIFLATLLSLPFSAYAGIQHPNCNGSISYDANLDLDKTIWAGSWWHLKGSGWEQADDYSREIDLGNVGAGGNSAPPIPASGQLGGTDYYVCWSSTPFTNSNTDNGESCTHTVGGLPFTTGSKYYRFNLDKSTSPATYCQVEMTTSSTVPGRGNTRVVELTDTQAIPMMSFWGLGILAGLLLLLGTRKNMV